RVVEPRVRRHPRGQVPDVGAGEVDERLLAKPRPADHADVRPGRAQHEAYQDVAGIAGVRLHDRRLALELGPEPVERVAAMTAGRAPGIEDARAVDPLLGLALGVDVAGQPLVEPRRVVPRRARLRAGGPGLDERPDLDIVRARDG